MHRSRFWRWLGALAFVVLAAATFGSATIAGAQSDAELERRKRELREQVNEQKAERDQTQANLLAGIAELDVAEADLADVLRALNDLNDLVAQQRADLDLAELELDAAEQAVVAITDRIGQIEGRRERLEGRMHDLIIQNYIGNDAAAAGSFGLARTGDIYEAARIHTLVGSALGDLASTADELHSLNVDADQAYVELAAAVVFREELVEQAQDQLQQLLESVSSQEQLRFDVEERYDRKLYEARSLEALDAEAAELVRTSEQQLLNVISEQQRREAEKRRRAEEERRRREEAARLAAIRAAGGSAPPTGQVSESELVWVGGIRVHASIAVPLRNLLDAAAADGIVFGGGGYRSGAQQIYLRRAHCGTSQWAIYSKPSYQCRPPTARPGYSMHEKGLAIDFTYNGRTITSRNNAGFRWLRANAAGYGLYNLPSEPWHWSTSGK